MKITEVQAIEAQMVEFDEDVRYLRMTTPGVAGYNWFRPLGDVEALELRFVLMPFDQHLKLEGLFKDYVEGRMQ